MAKPATAPNKPPRCRPAPKPTLDDYRNWYQQACQRNKDLQADLGRAKVTVDALAEALRKKRPYPFDNSDIPF